MIAQCVCSSSFQDSKYGKGMRVFNQTKTAGTGRCSVCGKLAGVSGR